MHVRVIVTVKSETSCRIIKAKNGIHKVVWVHFNLSIAFTFAADLCMEQLLIHVNSCFLLKPPVQYLLDSHSYTHSRTSLGRKKIANNLANAIKVLLKMQTVKF